MKLTIVTVQRPSGPFEIEGWVHGCWAAHPKLGAKLPSGAHYIELDNWSVTHVPSGLRVPREFTEDEAIRTARRLGDEVRCPTRIGAVRAGTRILEISDEERS